MQCACSNANNHITGFCFLNSVAVAAKHAITSGQAQRVVIIDWDIHHGNGTENLTYDDSNIMYISLHRYGNGFFPETGRHDEVSDGTNINIAWLYGKMGNVEYAAAFSELILPLLSEWSPDLILVSCGLDAAKGDLLGDCELTPDMYHSMTRSLVAFGVPMVMALEGGYNLDVIAKCMQAVTLALLDEPCPDIEESAVSVESPVEEGEVTSVDRLEAARRVLLPFWDYNKASSSVTYQKRMKPGARQCLNKTMEAVENSKLWLDRITFRRFVQNTPERTMTTRAYRRHQGEGDLSDAMKSLQL